MYQICKLKQKKKKKNLLKKSCKVHYVKGFHLVSQVRLLIAYHRNFAMWSCRLRPSNIRKQKVVHFRWWQVTTKNVNARMHEKKYDTIPVFSGNVAELDHAQSCVITFRRRPHSLQAKEGEKIEDYSSCMCEPTCVLLVLETLSQRIEQVQFLLKRWSYPSGCFPPQALSFLQCRAMDWPIGIAWNETLTTNFKKETLLKVYPGIERIPSLKKSVGTDIGGNFINVEKWIKYVFLGWRYIHGHKYW